MNSAPLSPRAQAGEVCPPCLASRPHVVRSAGFCMTLLCRGEGLARAERIGLHGGGNVVNQTVESNGRSGEDGASPLFAAANPSLAAWVKAVCSLSNSPASAAPCGTPGVFLGAA